MKKLFIAGLAVLAAACTKTPGTDTANTPVLQIGRDVIDVPAGGGEFSVLYTVANPSGDAVPSAESDADWVEGIEISEDGRILFDVLRNPVAQARQTAVRVVYPGAESRSFTVRQSSGGNFTLDQLVVETYADGGTCSVTYGSFDGTNPATIQTSASAGWVKNFVTTTLGRIEFTVDPSDDITKRRECTVSVGFNDDPEPQTFTMIQNAGSLELRVDNLTFKGVTYSVIPADKTMTYVTQYITAETFERYESDEEIYENDMRYFEMAAELIHNMTLESYLARILVSGDTQRTEILKPETSYYIYAYGLSLSGERTTEIVKKKITTPKVQKISELFNMEYFYNGDNGSVTVNISPTKNVYQPYYFSVMKTTGLPLQHTDPEFGAQMVEIMQGYLDYLVSEYAFREGLTIPEVMDKVLYKGISQNTFACEAGHGYVIFAASVDAEAGIVISDPTVQLFSTELPEPSSNVIALSVNNATFKTVDIGVTTSNGDQYIYMTTPKDFYKNRGITTDEGIIADMAKRAVNLPKLSGDNVVKLSTETMSSFDPDTQYEGYAIGWVNGYATTGLSKISFSTKGLGKSDITLNLAADKYFDAKALKEAYPVEFANMSGAFKIVLPVRASVYPAQSGATFRYQIYAGDFETSIGSNDRYNMAESLLSEGSGRAEANIYMPWDEVYTTPYTLVGIVADENGNYGEMFRKKFTFSQAGCSPVSEYVSPVN